MEYAKQSNLKSGVLTKLKKRLSGVEHYFQSNKIERSFSHSCESCGSSPLHLPSDEEYIELRSFINPILQNRSLALRNSFHCKDDITPIGGLVIKRFGHVFIDKGDVEMGNHRGGTVAFWCDHCDKLIWSCVRLECANCGMTCHGDCARATNLSCPTSTHALCKSGTPDPTTLDEEITASLVSNLRLSACSSPQYYTAFSDMSQLSTDVRHYDNVEVSDSTDVTVVQLRRHSNQVDSLEREFSTALSDFTDVTGLSDSLSRSTPTVSEGTNSCTRFSFLQSESGSISSSTSVGSALFGYDLSSLDAAAIQQHSIRVDEDPCFSSSFHVPLLSWTDEEKEEAVSLYNSVQENRQLHLQVLREADGQKLVQGLSRVFLNLVRPIKMSLTARPPSLLDIISGAAASAADDSTANGNPMDTPPVFAAAAGTTSFFLPRGTSRLLHLTEMTTAQEVINMLLRKHCIRDTPAKFALYLHTVEGDRHVRVRRMLDIERPLQLVLSWTQESRDTLVRFIERCRFVLQENDSNQVDWNAFSVPELENFLLILRREENEYARLVRTKYASVRRDLEMRMAKARSLALTDGAPLMSESAS